MNVLLVIVTGIVSHILVSVTFFANHNFQEVRLGLGLNITALVDLVPKLYQLVLCIAMPFHMCERLTGINILVYTVLTYHRLYPQV